MLRKVRGRSQRPATCVHSDLDAKTAPSVMSDSLKNKINSPKTKGRKKKKRFETIEANYNDQLFRRVSPSVILACWERFLKIHEHRLKLNLVVVKIKLQKYLISPNFFWIEKDEESVEQSSSSSSDYD